MWDPKITIEEVRDPVQVERHRQQREQFDLNCMWLEKHWQDLLPQARGKFLAVAGQEPFLADTAEKARAMAHAKHPHDKGVLVEYVLPNQGPRSYGVRICSSTEAGLPAQME